MNPDQGLLPNQTAWVDSWFALGKSIAKDQFKEVTASSLYALFLPDFEAQLKRSFLIDGAPNEDWWEGLRGLTKAWAKKISQFIPHEQLPDRLDFKTWGLMFYAGMRRFSGKIEDGTEFHAEWTEDSLFIRSWAEAVALTTREREGRAVGLFILALLWDTFYIPLRYFDDIAAIEYLQRVGLQGSRPHFSLSGYRNLWRGERGLGLIRHKDKTVVTFAGWPRNVFEIDVPRAKNLGIDPRPLSIGRAGKTPLASFEFQK